MTLTKSRKTVCANGEYYTWNEKNEKSKQAIQMVAERGLMAKMEFVLSGCEVGNANPLFP